MHSGVWFRLEILRDCNVVSVFSCFHLLLNNCGLNLHIILGRAEVIDVITNPNDSLAGRRRSLTLKHSIDVMERQIMHDVNKAFQA